MAVILVDHRTSRGDPRSIPLDLVSKDPEYSIDAAKISSKKAAAGMLLSIIKSAGNNPNASAFTPDQEGFEQEPILRSVQESPRNKQKRERPAAQQRVLVEQHQRVLAEQHQRVLVEQAEHQRVLVEHQRFLAEQAERQRVQLEQAEHQRVLAEHQRVLPKQAEHQRALDRQAGQQILVEQSTNQWHADQAEMRWAFHCQQLALAEHQQAAERQRLAELQQILADHQQGLQNLAERQWVQFLTERQQAERQHAEQAERQQVAEQAEQAEQAERQRVAEQAERQRVAKQAERHQVEQAIRNVCSHAQVAQPITLSQIFASATGALGKKSVAIAVPILTHSFVPFFTTADWTAHQSGKSKK